MKYEVDLDTDFLDELFSRKDNATLVLENEYFKEASPLALNYLGISSIAVFRSLHPAMISPEFQLNKVPSKIEANRAFSLLKNHHSIRFLWQHINIESEPFNVEVTLRKRSEENEYIDVHWKLRP